MDIVTLTQIKVGTGPSVRLVRMQEVVGRAVALLEAAGRELGQTQEAARSSIARAASILRAGIGHPAQLSSPRGGTAALLAWQSRRVLDYIEEHLGTPIRVSDLSLLLNRTEAHRRPGSRSDQDSERPLNAASLLATGRRAVS